MRALVCGDRNWVDLLLIRQTLVKFHPVVVIEGEARGADKLGRKVAEGLGIPVLPFPANWKLYGKRAGMIRNTQMLDEGKPDIVLAFHNDIANSKGTSNMIMQATNRGIKVILITEKEDTLISKYITRKKK